ncbi:MAG TPA: hypothetical protein VGD81_08340 [Opitutaceae bacterium]
MIRYDEIPRDERCALRKRVWAEDRRLRYKSGFCIGFAVFVGLHLAAPGANEPSQLRAFLLGIVFSAGFGYLFTEAIVEPAIRARVEEKKNQQS